MRALSLASALAVLLGALAPPLRAHPLTITQVLASFSQPGVVEVRMDIDLTPLLPSPEAYFALATAPPAGQRKGIDALVPEVTESLQLWIGRNRLPLILQDFKLPTLPREEFLDPTSDHFTLLRFLAILPESREPIRLVVGPRSRIAYPVAFVVEIPSAHVSDASWIQDETEQSDEIDWAAKAPKAAAAR